MRATLVAATLVAAGTVGVTSASAAVPGTKCTSTYPEVCLGVFTTLGIISHERVQVNLDHNTWYQFEIIQADGNTIVTAAAESSASGWYPNPADQFEDNGFGQVCAVAFYGPSEADVRSATSAAACFQ